MLYNTMDKEKQYYDMMMWITAAGKHWVASAIYGYLLYAK